MSISDDDGSLSSSPKLSQTDSHSKSKTRGKQLFRAAHKKTHEKNSRPKSPTPVIIPEPSLVSPFVFVARRLYSLEGRPTTPRDLERVRAQYNILTSVRLRVPRNGKHLEQPHSDGVALHIDFYDLDLCLPLQPFFRKMFNKMQIAPRQLSLPGRLVYS